MSDNLDYSSSKLALGDQLFETIENQTFCIVGCGGVGSLFAEMLVRTGAKTLFLIDGDTVEAKNLNRSFTISDIGSLKVCALEKRLKSIRRDIEIKTHNSHLRRDVENKENRVEKGEGINLLAQSQYVIIAADDNKTRLLCETECLAQKVEFLSVGIEIECNGYAFYECAWRPATPEKEIDRKGYGVNNGSYASIVMEATAVGFQLLLANILDKKNTPNKRSVKIYKRFSPVTDCVTPKSNILFRILSYFFGRS